MVQWTIEVETKHIRPAKLLWQSFNHLAPLAQKLWLAEIFMVQWAINIATNTADFPLDQPNYTEKISTF